MRRWFARQPRRVRRFYVGFYLYEALFFAVVIATNRSMWPFFQSLAIILAAALGGGLALQRRQRDDTWLYLTPDRVGYQGLGAPPREVLLNELRVVWRCSPLVTRRWQSIQPRQATLLLIGGLERCRLCVSVASFRDSDVERFLGQLTVPVEGSFVDGETASRLEERFPGAFPWRMRHPWLLAWSIVGGCLIVATAGVAIALAIR